MKRKERDKCDGKGGIKMVSESEIWHEVSKMFWAEDGRGSNRFKLR